ncbi:MAG: AsmA-like C-terminal region-containing protein, partial [Acidobacteria bacterium]|nr:AsmA-like C-terminal region-containing protein [Acidobacteriota bacterium]
HKITADANNVQFLLEPEMLAEGDEARRYRIDLSSSGSVFVYDGRELRDIDIQTRGVAYATGADISELRIETPIGVSTMSGQLTDWEALKYDLNIESTVDLTQTSNIFPLGTSINGIGNFRGRVTGEGDTYRLEGTIDSESLTAEGIYLRGLNVAATVEGTNTSYNANGNAIAQLLTFDDFRIEFPKLNGNVRGTGTDFRWVGELQAAAAKSGAIGLGGLFLSDAVAEYKDRQLTASAGNTRAQKFSISDLEFSNFVAGGLRLNYGDGAINLSTGNLRAVELKSPDYRLRGIRARSARVNDRGERTDVQVDDVTADSGTIDDARLRGLRADRIIVTHLPASTDLTARNVRAAEVDINGTQITGVESPVVNIRNNPTETVLYSESTRVARIDTDSAVLGSLNIAGVRLTVREGRIEGRSDDIDAGNVALTKSGTVPEGGRLENVKFVKPVFVLEPSGRYRASADMSLGGGVIGSIPLGNARASVNINNDRVELNELTAKVMDGQVNGRAVVGLNNQTRSNLDAAFTDLDLAKILAVQGGRVVPLEGKATGNVNLTFAGTDFATSTGTVNADLAANAGSADRGFVPVTGRVALTAANGLFNVDEARLNTERSQLTASGRFDLRNKDSNLDIALNSTDASEIDRLVRVLGVAPDTQEQLDSLDARLAGNLTFTGRLTGNVSDPTIDGRASLDSVSLRGRELGALTTDVFVSPAGFELRNGNLREPAGGGTVAFNVSIPSGGVNNVSVQATFNNVNAGNLLAALPIDLPTRLRDFTGQTSGTVNLTGLPNNSQGEINIQSAAGTI